MQEDILASWDHEHATSGKDEVRLMYTEFDSALDDIEDLNQH